jgi:hypothetical protein
MLTSCDGCCHTNVNISDHEALQRIVWYVAFSESYIPCLIYHRSIVVSYAQYLRINDLKSRGDGSTMHSEPFSFLNNSEGELLKGTNGGLVQT